MKIRASLATVALVVAASAPAGLVAAPATAAGTTYAVDGASSACSDSGTGTSARPFCTIGAATRVATAPGDTVRIAPAGYREQVTVAGSGATGSPLTLEATGPGVVVLGTRDLGGATWTPGSAPAPVSSWQTSYAPPSAPRQVFLAGTRLTQASGTTTLASGGWYYDASAKVLTVDLGGPSPSGQALEAGAQSYGVNVVGRHDVRVRGIDARGANYAGVRVSGSTAVEVSTMLVDRAGTNGALVEASSSAVTLAGVIATGAASTGIKVSGSAQVTVKDGATDHNGLHGISISGSPQAVVTGNISHDNQAVTGTATAAGIDLSGSTDARIVGNTTWGNQDTGVQLGSGASRAVVARNVTHHNGDHGVHVLGATGVTLLNNTSVQNRRDGIALESGSTAARLANNVLTDNGAATSEYDLLVDSSSVTGLVADYDLVWNPTPRNALKVGGTVYRSVRDYAAAGTQEAHALAVDPGLADVPGGDLGLSESSPALDSADAGVAGFVGTDPWTPVDDTQVPDRGAGNPPYADRGAREFNPSQSGNHPPHAAMFLNPAKVAVPPSATVTADASGSSDADAYPIATYAFDFGDGTTTGPQTGPVATHVYATPGTYTVTVTVTDVAGAASTATASEVVAARPPVTYRVDRGSAACADAGPGTAAQPLCSLAAGARRAVAGDTVSVAAGIYPEQVNLLNSGESGAPITVVGDPGAVVSGADTSSGAAGARSYGFLVRGVSDLTVRGFTVRGAVTGVLLDRVSGTTLRDVESSGNTAYGISVDHASATTVTGVEAHHNGSTGVRLLDDSDTVLSASQAHDNAFHGVSVQASTRVTVRGVTAYANSRPSTRSATGIDVSAGSVDTLVEDNQTWGNQDSGIEAYTDAVRTVIRRNLTWSNGDHGIDDYRAPGTLIVSNTVVGNATAGINLEGGSSGGTVRDNVTVDNAVGSTRTVGEIRVDTASVPGTTVDRDLIWKSAPGTVFEWAGKSYPTLAAFTAATGQEPTGRTGEPRFADRSAQDFRLTAGSPAIDAAQAGVAGWRATDQAGVAPFDDPLTPDTGTGSPAYADLGAREYLP